MATKLPGEEKFIKIVVQNLRKKEEQDGNDSQKHGPFEISVNSDYTLRELWCTLEQEYGCAPPDKLKQTGDGRSWRKLETKAVFHPYTEFEIVSDKSAADGTHIYINESLQAATHRDQNVKFDIEYAGRGRTSLMIDNDLELVFHRTVRMPDDDRLHSLPASLGTFPLYNTEDYADRLPENILEKGGLFLPMWQREALWVELSRSLTSSTAAMYDKNYAIRVYVGQINAVSGKNMMEERGNQQKQDYLIFPGQPWIDGICVAPGVVRQFVAMPLGSGYTVEGQKTGEEKHGGLQIEIIPAYPGKAQKWLAATEEEALQNSRLYLDETKTPAQLGLKAGSQVRMYPSPPTYYKPIEVGDLYRTKEDSCLGVVNLEAFYYNYGDLSDWGGAARVPVSSSFSARMPRSVMSENSPSSSGESSESQALTSSATATEYDAHDETRFVPRFLSNKKRRDARKSHRKGGPPESSEVNNSPPAQVLNVKAMGLAAGGKLVQDIVADHNPPNTWNVDAARLINIHILDSVSCESVTHIVPPPIPMSAYQAVLSKLPFFVVEEQIDNRLEGGDFDNVKSVSKMDETKGIKSEPSLDPNRPVMCSSCEKRLCDCVVRPCDHQFCNMCIRAAEPAMEDSVSGVACCPRCNEKISRVAGFSAPMNLPGEESIRTKMPVRVLKVDDGRVRFESIIQTRV